MFSQSPEAYLYGGPFVPTGYQSISGTFSGASPQSIEQKLLTRSSGTKLLSVEYILMMSGSQKVASYRLGGNLKDRTYHKVNARLSIFLRMLINPRLSTCLKVINLKVSTQLKVSIHLLVNHFYKELEMYRLIISPMFSQIMVLHMHNLLLVHTLE